jgi:hypothetical protein
MIKKLKKHSAEELEDHLKRAGLCSPFTYLPVADQPPTNEELMDKINEIIEHINKLEKKK